MIISKTVNVKVNSNHLKYYKELGYNVRFRDTLSVNPLHLPKNSRVLVEVQCNKCKNKKTIQYRQYKLKKDNCYYCVHCNPFRKKIEYTKESKEMMIAKIKETFNNKSNDWWEKKDKKTKQIKLKKYGDPTFNNQEKKNKTLKELYGDPNFNNLEKRKETLKNRYGNPNFNNQEKKKKTCIKKYGVEHTNHVPEIFNKIQRSAFKINKYKDL